MVNKPQSLLTVTSKSNPAREWYFGFCANELGLPRWMRAAVWRDPPHLHHCYAFSQVGDYVLFVEPSRQKIDFVVKYPTPDYPKIRAATIALELTAHDHTIVRSVHIPNLGGLKAVTNVVPSCVTVVKCATGYASFAITPKQLMVDLLANGGYIIQ